MPAFYRNDAGLWPNEINRKRKRDEIEPETSMSWFRSLKQRIFGKEEDPRMKVPRFDDFERKNRETAKKSSLNLTSTPKPKQQRRYSWFKLKEKETLSKLIQKHLIEEPSVELKQNATQTETVIDLANEAIEKLVIEDSDEKERLKSKCIKDHNPIESSIAMNNPKVEPEELPDSVKNLKQIFVEHSNFFDTDWLKKYREDIFEDRSIEKRTNLEKEQQLEKIKEDSRVRRQQIDNVLKRRFNDSELPFSLYTLYISKPPEEEEEEQVEITELMNDVIDSSLNDGSNDDILVNNLKRADLHTLLDLNWLNDEIINEYFTLIENTFDDVKCLNTFFYKRLKSNGFQGVKRWTKKFDLFSYSLILIPLHLQVHWTLISISIEDKSIHYYDSMSTNDSTSGQKHLETIRLYLQDEYKDKKGGQLDVSEWKLIEEKKIPLQLNGSDCGMFCCKYAYYLSKRKSFSFHQSMMPYFRRRMIYELVTQTLL